MGETTKIQWTDHTWNLWTGCTEVSPGCDNCYARTLAKRYWKTEWGAGAPRYQFKHAVAKAYDWNRKAIREGVRRRVFCMSLADWADREVPDEWRSQMWRTIRECEHLDFQMLTKRHISPDVLPDDWGNGYPNVWMGVSVENQHYVHRLSNLRSIDARVKWVSIEPMLGAVVSARWAYEGGITWFVIGGESKQDFPARAFDPDWARNVISDLQNTNARIFIKQLGSNPVGLNLRDKQHGANLWEWPADLRLQQFPTVE